MKISSFLARNLAYLLMCSSLFVSGQTDVEARAAEASQALVKGYIAWRTKLSSPGASIQAKEIARAGSLVKYNLHVSGLPTNQLYTLMSWLVGQPKPAPMMQGLSIGKKWNCDVRRKDSRAVRRLFTEG